MGIEDRRILARQQQVQYIQERAKKGLVIIADRDPLTGEWQAKEPDGGIIQGNKLYNSTDEIRGVEEYQKEKFNFIGKTGTNTVRDTREIGYHKGQQFSFPIEKEVVTLKLKYLVIVKKPTEIIGTNDYCFFVGGHKIKPVLVTTLRKSGFVSFVNPLLYGVSNSIEYTAVLSNLPGNNFILDLSYTNSDLSVTYETWKNNTKINSFIIPLSFTTVYITRKHGFWSAFNSQSVDANTTVFAPNKAPYKVTTDEVVSSNTQYTTLDNANIVPVSVDNYQNLFTNVSSREYLTNGKGWQETDGKYFSINELHKSYAYSVFTAYAQEDYCFEFPIGTVTSQSYESGYVPKSIGETFPFWMNNQALITNRYKLIDNDNSYSSNQQFSSTSNANRVVSANFEYYSPYCVSPSGNTAVSWCLKGGYSLESNSSSYSYVVACSGGGGSSFGFFSQSVKNDLYLTCFKKQLHSEKFVGTYLQNNGQTTVNGTNSGAFSNSENTIYNSSEFFKGEVIFNLDGSYLTFKQLSAFDLFDQYCTRIFQSDSGLYRFETVPNPDYDPVDDPFPTLTLSFLKLFENPGKKTPIKIQKCSLQFTQQGYKTEETYNFSPPAEYLRSISGVTWTFLGISYHP